MKTTRFAALTAALILLFSAAFAEDADLPLVALGDRVFYTVEDGNILMHAELAARGGNMTEDELRKLRDDVMQTLKDQAVLTLKYEELGLDRANPEEEAELKKTAGTAYEDAISQVAEQLRESYGGEEEKSLITARALMDQAGMTYEAVLEQVYARWKSLRLAEAVAGGMTVTDREVDELYLTECVEPDRIKYQDDIDMFEQEVLFGEGTSCYVPAEYRLVQWILLPPEEPLAGELHAAAEAADGAYSNAVKAYEATFGSFDSDQAMKDARDAYDEALAAYSAAGQELEAVKQQALEAASDTVDKILGEYQAGVPWDELIERYSSDTSTLGNPYPVNEASSITPDVIKEAAMSIGAEGEAGGPVSTEEGVLLVMWLRDVPEGPAEISPETRESLKTQLLDRKMAERVVELLAGWRDEYEIAAWPERLAVPET